MTNIVPDCYEADVQAEARELAYTARIMRRPRCERCGVPLIGDTYVDLGPFGLKGYACERCVTKCTYNVEDLEADL